MNVRYRLSAIGLLVGLLVSAPGWAQHDDDQGRRSPGGSTEQRYDLDSSVSRLRKSTRGRVLSAETRSNDKGEVHHIRIINERGKVKRYRIDAESGRQLPPSRR